MPWVEPDAEIADISAWFAARGKELWIKPHGLGHHAVVIDAGNQSGQALLYYADSELDAARLARRSYVRGQMMDALRAVGRVAQTQAGQVLIAELALARLPILKKPYIRQATVATAVWMVDDRNRRAITRIGTAAIDLAVVSSKERRVQDLAATSMRMIEPALRALGTRSAAG